MSLTAEDFETPLGTAMKSGRLGTLSSIPPVALGHDVLSCLEPNRILRARSVCRGFESSVATDGAFRVLSQWIGNSFRWHPPAPPTTERGEPLVGYPSLPPILLPSACDIEGRGERFVKATGWSGYRLDTILRGLDSSDAGMVAWAGSSTSGFARLLSACCTEVDHARVSTVSSGVTAPHGQQQAALLAEHLFDARPEGPAAVQPTIAQYARGTMIFVLSKTPGGETKVLRAQGFVGSWRDRKNSSGNPPSPPGTAAGDAVVPMTTVSADAGEEPVKWSMQFVADVEPVVAELVSKGDDKKEKQKKSKKVPTEAFARRGFAALVLFNLPTVSTTIGSAITHTIGYIGPPVLVEDTSIVQYLDVRLGRGNPKDDVLRVLPRLRGLWLDRVDRAVADAICAPAAEGDSLPLRHLVLRNVPTKDSAGLNGIVNAPLLRHLESLLLESGENPDKYEAMPGLTGVAWADTIRHLHIPTGFQYTALSVEHHGAPLAAMPHLRTLELRTSGLSNCPTDFVAAFGKGLTFERLELLALQTDSASDDQTGARLRITAPSMRLAAMTAFDPSLPEPPPALMIDGCAKDQLILDVRIQRDSMYHPGLMSVNARTLLSLAAQSLRDSGALPDDAPTTDAQASEDADFAAKASASPIILTASNMIGTAVLRTFSLKTFPPTHPDAVRGPVIEWHNGPILHVKL